MRPLCSLFIIGYLTLFWSCNKPKPPVTDPAPIQPVPTQAQLDWHDMKMNAFIHFTINTFTDREWGVGNESEKEFDPTDIDVDQWITVLKETGFKGVILTCKHHDGFCLWPSKYTEHDIANSPFMNGKGDVVKLVSDACKKNGLKFGVYLSPWDRNHKDYGKPEYITYYRNQLNEVFDNYGPVFEMWFDGANGGNGYYGGKELEQRKIDGSNYYDWPATLDIVRQKNPDIIFFSDAGPGVRWVGNERGEAGRTNWNNISIDTLYAGKPGIEKLLNTGSEEGTSWVPAETDVSIRPGWFYHEREDVNVKTPEQLFDIYLNSVGRGSVLLLNIPPDKRGRFHDEDVKSLKGFRELLDREFKNDLAKGNTIEAITRGDDPKYAPSNMLDDDPGTYWAMDDNMRAGAIIVRFGKTTDVKYIVLKEYLKLGQRVKAFDIEYFFEGHYYPLISGTTIGHERILRGPCKADAIKIVINDARDVPLISGLEIY